MALSVPAVAPVALHLDHGKSEALARAAVDAGYTSVMIDASRESVDENVRETRDIVAYTHARGIHVEAELGTLGGIEDLGERSARSMLTDPDEALRFATDTEVEYARDSDRHLARRVQNSKARRVLTSSACRKLPHASNNRSCSTAHPPCPRKRSCSPERYGAKLPQARGIPTELIQHAVAMGIAKVNTDSDLRLVALGRAAASARGTAGPLPLYELGRDRGSDSTGHGHTHLPPGWRGQGLTSDRREKREHEMKSMPEADRGGSNPSPPSAQRHVALARAAKR